MKLSRYTLKPARIEMIPLIDIVFLLLVFFIYAMLSMAVHNALPVQLPSSSAAQIDTQETIAVTLKTDGENLSVFVDEKLVHLEELSTTLTHAKKAKEETEPEVQIYGDQTVSYQQLFEVLDRVKGAGIHRISLAAEVEKE